MAPNIAAALARLRPGLEVRGLPECESTNTLALAHLREGGGPLLLVAEHQTAGRGRLGRAWVSARGDSLTFSLALALPQTLDLSGLSLTVGCAVADALEPDGEQIRLKWPNDLLLAGAKLGGILVETLPLPGTDQRGVVIGIGLNIAPLPAEADRSAFATGHAALRALLPAISAEQALERIAMPLLQALADFESLGGFAPWQSAFARRDLSVGRGLRVGGLSGAGRGVSARGELLVESGGQVHAVSGGEVSLQLD
jgi:BirA family biotin operon repressor/biotin-[acetyl-CoA-carboxylase] ligase